MLAGKGLEQVAAPEIPKRVSTAAAVTAHPATKLMTCHHRQREGRTAPRRMQ